MEINWEQLIQISWYHKKREYETLEIENEKGFNLNSIKATQGNIC